VFLRIAGSAFAVGVPFVNAWYEPARRGFATGVFGAGMAGTAVAAFFTPRLVKAIGYVETHLLIAGVLAATAVMCWTVMRDAPAWRANTDRVVPKLAGAAKLAVTWQLSFLYAVTFGAFVALSSYLPTYLKTVYDFSQTEAGTRTAGFALVAVLARPVGGMLSDRVQPRLVVMVSLLGTAVMAATIASRPGPELPAGAAFVALSFFLGIGTGGVFAWVARRAPAERVGAVTGIVGAAGGLGGYFPPLIMGATYDAASNSYAIGLSLLVATALVALVFVAVVLRERRGSTVTA
jgi:NNP family nitrate/nitrite transporter-like MFS transporter